MNSLLKINPKLKWLENPSIKPYVYVRPSNRVAHPGQFHKLDWFQQEPVYKNPLEMDDVYFADAIINMETQAFEHASMAMPRWVFYDCAVMPGFVAGFAYKTKDIPEMMKKAVVIDPTKEWTPISLFIIIPTMTEKEWVAHNLSSVNSLIPETERLYGLGFLTKAFGLWYANIEINLGMTQWNSPALKLHSNYGYFEVLTAYTPVHSYSQTLTYRLRPVADMWQNFFSHQYNEDFSAKYRSANFVVETTNEKSLIELQRKIETGKERYFLSSHEIRSKPLGQSYTVYNRI
jgi:hypothetical protein